MNRILITGGAGFIGSNLVKYYFDNSDYDITIVDNYCSSIVGGGGNLEFFLDKKRVNIIKEDISYFNDDKEYDIVFNLACPASPKFYQKNPLDTINTCVNGLLNILEICRNNNSKFLHTSTSEVYGDPLIHPQKEDYNGNVNILSNRACYDEGKRIAETIIIEHYKKYNNYNPHIIRIFNTYGRNMFFDDGRVVPNFIMQCLSNKDITIYGDGTQTRSFMYVNDLIDAMVKIVDIDYHKPINVGNPYEITILELANIIKKLTKSKSDIIFKELPECDPVKRKPDITLVQSLIDWRPKIDIERGLYETINYFKQINNLPI